MNKNNKPLVKLKFRTIKPIWLLLLFLLFPLIIQAQSAIRGSLSGKIVAKNGSPVIGANLILQPDSHQVQTDKNGYFTFKNIIAGEYTVAVSYIGYKAYQNNVLIEADKKSNVKITLEEEENVNVIALLTEKVL